MWRVAAEKSSKFNHKTLTDAALRSTQAPGSWGSSLDCCRTRAGGLARLTAAVSQLAWDALKAQRGLHADNGQFNNRIHSCGSQGWKKEVSVETHKAGRSQPANARAKGPFFCAQTSSELNKSYYFPSKLQLQCLSPKKSTKKHSCLSLWHRLTRLPGGLWPWDR